MDRYQDLFQALEQRRQGALVPFFMLEDPNYEASLTLIEAAIEAGADALELGVAFSDPVADGPVIQRAHLRAQNSGATFASSLRLVAQIRAKYPAIPIGMLIYANVPFALGLDNFYSQLAAAGVDSVLLPDVPLRESAPFREAARSAGVSQVFIAPPGAEAAQLRRIGQASGGYVYLVSRAGVTGTENKAALDHIRSTAAQLASFDAPPALVGFGISSAEDVAAVIAAGAGGAICGSAIVRLIESAAEAGGAKAVEIGNIAGEVKDFVASLKAGTRRCSDGSNHLGAGFF